MSNPRSGLEVKDILVRRARDFTPRAVELLDEISALIGGYWYVDDGALNFSQIRLFWDSDDFNTTITLADVSRVENRDQRVPVC